MNKDKPDQTRPLTTGEIAVFCHVTHRAVLKWVASGKLKAYRTPGNHSRVRVEDFVKFLQDYKMPLPQDFAPQAPMRKRILLVDDDKGIVHAIQRLFMMSNEYDLDNAYDGFEAGKKFFEFKPDLVILDIHMPGLNGFEVCSRIRQDQKNDKVKILVLSGVGEEEEIKRILSLGANAYMSKPFSNKQLYDKIKELLGEAR